MSRVPIVKLFQETTFLVGAICKGLFYYLPLWMMGNKWCNSCMKIIKRHEPLYAHSTQAEDFHLCQECEDSHI